jgi:hypothetical protein
MNAVDYAMRRPASASLSIGCRFQERAWTVADLIHAVTRPEFLVLRVVR